MRQVLPVLLIILFASFTIKGKAQERELIQFSGVVVDGDSLFSLPFTTVIIKNTNRGTISDYYGYFSFVAQVHDTIEFTSIGYKKSTFVIPDTLKENRYSLIQVMFKDTIMLRETVIYPWPTREQFKEAFLSLNIPDDDLERARKNLSREELKERYETMPMDASMNYRNQMHQYQSRLYYAGQYAPNRLLDPLAWAQFIKAWKEGKFARRE